MTDEFISLKKASFDKAVVPSKLNDIAIVKFDNKTGVIYLYKNKDD